MLSPTDWRLMTDFQRQQMRRYMPADAAALERGEAVYARIEQPAPVASTGAAASPWRRAADPAKVDGWLAAFDRAGGARPAGDVGAAPQSPGTDAVDSWAAAFGRARSR